MKVVISIFGAFLCLSLVSPVQMHYLYADNSGTGYVSLNNGGETPLGFAGKQRRYMGYSNSQIYQRTSSDQVSKITKEPIVQLTPNEKPRSPTYQRSTEPPNHKQQMEEYSPNIHDPRNARSSMGKNQHNQNYRPAPNGKKEYKSQTKQYDATYNSNKGNIHDSKGNVQVNVHKTQIPAEPQKVKLNNNRQLTALSVQRREDNYKRMPSSVLVDKTLQKSASFKERNAKIMSRVLDDMTKKVSDRRFKTNDYKKRDIVNSYQTVQTNSNPKRNIASDTLKKYVGKEINMVGKNPPKESIRVGNHDEEVEENNAPYALFYRMSPESLDNHEGFYLMKSMEADGDKVFSPKEKRLTVNYQSEVDLKKAKTKKNINAVKLRKKVRHYSNFRDGNF